MRAALGAEWLKLARGLTPRIVTLGLLVGVLAVSLGLLSSGGRGNPAIDAQLAPFTTGAPWADLATLASVVMAAGGLLACGILLSWLYGREFSDRMVATLFASPTPRVAVAAAKGLLYLGWVVALAIALTLAVLAAGLLSGYGTPDPTVLGRLAAVTGLTGLLALPCAWVATLARSLLAPVGSAVALLVLAQLAVFTGVGAWFPFAAPGMWAGLAGSPAAGEVSAVQLALVIPTAAVFAGLTLDGWRRMRDPS